MLIFFSEKNLALELDFYLQDFHLIGLDAFAGEFISVSFKAR